MINGLLHIGSSDVIGREIRDNWNLPTCSHTEVSDFPLHNYDAISISAFDPKRKSVRKKNCKFLSEVINKCPRDTKLIYFSSCRILDYKFSLGKKTPYILNKLEDETKILREFKNACVVYLPNIIPKYIGQKSRFFEQFFNNLSKNTISFDAMKYSKWNFVQIHDVLEQILELNRFHTFEQILSPTDLRLASLVEKFACKDTKIEFGDRYEKYPRVRLKNARFCKSDTAKDLNWLEDVRKIYAE